MNQKKKYTCNVKGLTSGYRINHSAQNLSGHFSPLHVSAMQCLCVSRGCGESFLQNLISLRNSCHSCLVSRQCESNRKCARSACVTAKMLQKTDVSRSKIKCAFLMLILPKYHVLIQFFDSTVKWVVSCDRAIQFVLCAVISLCTTRWSKS